MGVWGVRACPRIRPPTHPPAHMPHAALCMCATPTAPFGSTTLRARCSCARSAGGEACAGTQPPSVSRLQGSFVRAARTPITGWTAHDDVQTAFDGVGRGEGPPALMVPGFGHSRSVPQAASCSWCATTAFFEVGDRARGCCLSACSCSTDALARHALSNLLWLPSPVPPRCFPAELVTEREEHAGEEERGQTRSGLGQQDEDGWAGDEGVSGRLGRAFVEGYNTQTPAGGLGGVQRAGHAEPAGKPGEPLHAKHVHWPTHAEPPCPPCLPADFLLKFGRGI